MAKKKGREGQMGQGQGMAVTSLLDRREVLQAGHSRVSIVSETQSMEMLQTPKHKTISEHRTSSLTLYCQTTRV